MRGVLLALAGVVAVTGAHEGYKRLRSGSRAEESWSRPHERRGKSSNQWWIAEYNSRTGGALHGLSISAGATRFSSDEEEAKKIARKLAGEVGGEWAVWAAAPNGNQFWWSTTSYAPTSERHQAWRIAERQADEP